MTTVADVPHLVMLFSMKISQEIREQHGATMEEVEAGMAEKSREFAEAGNRVYLPMAQ
ncbi:hypothetical protein [Streptomyces spirodelae]|uniref:Thiamine biosynthesis protein ThiC n=1 Tax=Streptomyces spirodelae TaxID=2812904 RepID=A0ABS3WVZ3_9ACTN|nr:hypothetical protein [Streptomyces spirodelae]MBO8187277.1 hypothetical protein [Streptomyces spirodelae]